jgi:hypothetical protein
VFSTVRAYIFANTAADDTIEIAPEKPVSGVVQSIIDESTMPAGLSFRASSERSTGIALTSATGADSCINPGEWAAIWIKRTVPAGARAYDNNGYTIRVDGDTGE